MDIQLLIMPKSKLWYELLWNNVDYQSAIMNLAIIVIDAQLTRYRTLICWTEKHGSSNEQALAYLYRE